MSKIKKSINNKLRFQAHKIRGENNNEADIFLI